MPSAAARASVFSMTCTAGSKAFGLVHEAADQEVGRLGELAGVGVDDGEHRDDALLGQRPAVLERGLGDAADASGAST